jgi:hypothetical protein
MRERGIGNDTHQPYTSTAKHDADLATRQFDGDRFSRSTILGPRTRARPAEDANTAKHGQRTGDRFHPTNLYPRPWTV